MKKVDVPALQAAQLKDSFSRTISYLRLSVTDRCNLRCMYCMPCSSEEEDTGLPVFKNIDHRELLTYEEMTRVVKIAVSLGMSKLRLTGGEPLVRRGVMGFIGGIADIEGLRQIRLTTNGVLLEKYAAPLYDMGVRYLNISLDTLHAEKFKKITARDFFHQVIAGIDAAREAGFHIKLNVVAMKGTNDDEFAAFGRLAIEKNIQVRFIEFMPIGKGTKWQKQQYIASKDIISGYLGEFDLSPVEANEIDGPARVYQITDKSGRTGKLGFISPISHHFCSRCNRLRLTSEGKLRACLLHDGDTDLKSIMRAGCSDADIEQAIRTTILQKPKNHGIEVEGKEGLQPVCHGEMSRIGG